jgi:hypothetical protein
MECIRLSIYGIAVDPSTGNLYVTDPAAKQVLVFAPGGGYLFEFGYPGPDPGEFEQPNGIAISDVGLVFVADGINNRIEGFLLDGTNVASIQDGLILNGDTHLTDLWIEAGFLWVYDEGNNISEGFLLTDFHYTTGSGTFVFPGYRVTATATVVTPIPLTFTGEPTPGRTDAENLIGAGLTASVSVAGPSVDAENLLGACLTASVSVAGPTANAENLIGAGLTASVSVAGPSVDAENLVGAGLTASVSVAGPSVDAENLVGAGLTASVSVAGPSVETTNLVGCTIIFSGTVSGPSADALSVQVTDVTFAGSVAAATASGYMTTPVDVMFSGTVSAPLVDSLMFVQFSTEGGGCFAVNLRNGTVTQYDSEYAFNSFCEFEGKLYGANDTGVYELTGTSDDGQEIPWEIVAFLTDFGSPYIKRARCAWLGLRTNGAIVFSVIDENGTQYDYPIDSTKDIYSVMKTSLGRGTKSRYISWGLSGVAGSNIKLDEIEFALDKIQRMAP